MEDLIHVGIFGINLGTADSWDQVTDHGIVFYNFAPREGLSLPIGDLFIDIENGDMSITKSDDSEFFKRALDILNLADSIDKAAKFV